MEFKVMPSTPAGLANYFAERLNAAGYAARIEPTVPTAVFVERANGAPDRPLRTGEIKMTLFSEGYRAEDAQITKYHAPWEVNEWIVVEFDYTNAKTQELRPQQ